MAKVHDRTAIFSELTNYARKTMTSTYVQDDTITTRIIGSESTNVYAQRDVSPEDRQVDLVSHLLNMATYTMSCKCLILILQN